MTCIYNPIRINEPPSFGVIIAGLEEVETKVGVVEVATVAERVQSANSGGAGAGRGQQFAPAVILGLSRD